MVSPKSAITAAGIATALAGCNAIIGLNSADGGGGEGASEPGATSTSGGKGGAPTSSSSSSGAGPTASTGATSSDGGSAASSTGSKSDASSSSAGGALGCATLTDDFDMLPNPNWTVATMSGSDVSTNGVAVLSLAVVEGMQFVELASKATYSLAECPLSIELVELSSASPSLTYFEFADGTVPQSGSYLAIYGTAGTLTAISVDGTMRQSQMFSVAPPVFLRFRDDGVASVRFETSPDDATWTEQFMVPRPSWIDAGYVLFGLTGLIAADEAKFDKLNL